LFCNETSLVCAYISQAGPFRAIDCNLRTDLPISAAAALAANNYFSHTSKLIFRREVSERSVDHRSPFTVGLDLALAAKYLVPSQSQCYKNLLICKTTII